MSEQVGCSKVINTAVSTAISIVNMSDDKHIHAMAAHIADTLIALTNEKMRSLRMDQDKYLNMTPEEKAKEQFKQSNSKPAPACDGPVSRPTIDDEEMLARAMKKAVEVGIFPKHSVDTETYLNHWAGMKEVLKAALAD